LHRFHRRYHILRFLICFAHIRLASGLTPQKTTSVGLTVGLGLNLATATEYCSKEQYEHDHALIENALNTGIKGPKSLSRGCPVLC